MLHWKFSWSVHIAIYWGHCEIPLENRLAEPVEVAGTVLFLCTDNSNYITGENILVTGGHTMH